MGLAPSESAVDSATDSAIAEVESVELCEVFSSIQGEGPCVGYSTLFVRFANCDLRCAWCDTPGSWKAPRLCRLETERGSQEFKSVSNPVPWPRVIEACESLRLGDHRYLSITGGEPLLQAPAVARLAYEARKRGTRVHLETHGAAPDALAEVAGGIDLVSMDWKFSSDVRWAKDAEGRQRGESFADLSERSLRAAAGASQVYVKAVITPNTLQEEFDEMCARVAACDPGTPLVLQPVTPTGKLREATSPQRLFDLLLLAETRLRDVRLIPQTHKIYGVL